ncbi:hypothetical protein BJX68DRAFT_260704 [Aspergillus pseudodeflectus]|uniref:Dynamin N-terminal domain-containing protein n=1 Tax=Aspergillus pseudodeflectus TaxID=176178 RepID=A0ABR4LBJ9_9EURO
MGPETNGINDATTDPIKELKQTETRRLFNAMDSLRRLNLGTDEIPIPLLVVVGDQSSGKSSVLESIARISLPVGDDVCTRFPIEVVLRRSNRRPISMRIIPGQYQRHDETAVAQMNSFSQDILDPGDDLDLSDMIRDASRRIGVPIYDMDSAPIIGNLHRMSRSETWKQLVKLHAQYGPILTMKIGTRTVMLLQSRAAVRDLLEKKVKIYSSRPPLITTGEHVTRSLFPIPMPCNEYWRELHAIRGAVPNQRVAATTTGKLLTTSISDAKASDFVAVTVVPPLMLVHKPTDLASASENEEEEDAVLTGAAAKITFGGGSHWGSVVGVAGVLVAAMLAGDA